MGISVKVTARAIYLIPDDRPPGVDLRRVLPGVAVNRATGRGVLPRTPHVARRVLEALGGAISEADPALRADAALAESPRTPLGPPVLPPARTPRWAHQERALRFLLGLYGAGFPAAGLFSDLGTGKTRVAVDLTDALGARRVLVVAPRSAVYVWHREFRQHERAPHQVILPDPSASVAERVLRIRRRVWPSSGVPYVVVANYEMLIREPFRSFALTVPWDLVVADEAHRLKAPGGAISRFAAEVGQVAARRLALTGTPLHHSPLDAWGLYRFLDPGVFGMNYPAFERRYRSLAVVGGRSGRDKRRALEREFHDKLYSIAFRVTSDVLDLPEAKHTDIVGELGPEARERYRELERSLVVDVREGVVTVRNVLARLIKLQEVTSGFVRDDSGNVHVLGREKEDLLADFLSDLPRRELLVVFALFWHDLDTVARVSGRTGLRYGEVSGRRRDLDAWRAGNVDVCGVQFSAGSEAEDFSRARYALYYSTGWSLGDYVQSLARVHRAGQSRPVTYYHLIMRGTVDEAKRAMMDRRRDFIEGILEEFRSRKAPGRVLA